MTFALDATTIAAVLAWSALVFWLGRASAGGRATDLSAPPPRVTRRPAAGPRDPVVPPPDVLTAIRAELARGNKISAIKLMRDATGLGLAEAKREVESLEG